MKKRIAFYITLLTAGLPAPLLAGTRTAECPPTWQETKAPAASLREAQLWDREGRVDDAPPPSTSHRGKNLVDHWPMGPEGTPVDLRCIYNDGRQLSIHLRSSIIECQKIYHQDKRQPSEFSLYRALCLSRSTPQSAEPMNIVRYEAIDANLALDGLELGKIIGEIRAAARLQEMVSITEESAALSLEKGDDHWRVLFSSDGRSAEIIKEMHPDGTKSSNSFQRLMMRYGAPSSRNVDTKAKPARVEAEIWNWGKTGVRLEFRPSDGTGPLDAYDSGTLHLIADQPRKQ